MFLILRHSIAGTELPLSCGPVQHLKRERADIVATRPRIRARTANICSVRPRAVPLYRTYRGCADPKWDKEKKRSRRCRRLESYTGRRQTEWTGATQCPEDGRS